MQWFSQDIGFCDSRRGSVRGKLLGRHGFTLMPESPWFRPGGVVLMAKLSKPMLILRHDHNRK
jgi:hypothetical protein